MPGFFFVCFLYASQFVNHRPSFQIQIFAATAKTPCLIVNSTSHSLTTCCSMEREVTGTLIIVVLTYSVGFFCAFVLFNQHTEVNSVVVLDHDAIGRVNNKLYRA